MSYWVYMSGLLVAMVVLSVALGRVLGALLDSERED